jgi:hypothetical protein
MFGGTVRFQKESKKRYVFFSFTINTIVLNYEKNKARRLDFLLCI